MVSLVVIEGIEDVVLGVFFEFRNIMSIELYIQSNDGEVEVEGKS